MSKILSDVLNRNKWGTSTNLLHNNIFTGIEIELEGLSQRSFNGSSFQREYQGCFSLWTAVEDGSLQDGIEFICKEPLKGGLLADAISGLHRAINSRREIKATQRCGVHIHCDVRNYTASEIMNTLLVYMVFERAIYSYVSPTRYKNTFCRPLSSSDFRSTLTALLESFINESDEDKLEHLLRLVDEGRIDKYAGLNLRTIQNYGSFEFRMHEGTTDIINLLHWINILHSIMDMGKNIPVADLINMYDANPSLVYQLFSNTKLNAPSKSLEILKGIRDMKHILSYRNLDEISAELSSKTVGSIPVQLEQVLRHTNRSIVKKSL